MMWNIVRGDRGHENNTQMTRNLFPLFREKRRKNKIKEEKRRKKNQKEEKRRKKKKKKEENRKKKKKKRKK